jgi:hypothetical protein
MHIMLELKSVVGFLLFASLATVFYFYQNERQNEYLAVDSFQNCVDAGYEVRITYPESCVTPDNRVFTNPKQSQATSTYQRSESAPATSTQESFVVVTSVLPNQIIDSPLTVTGRARGFWYFEGSFPLELVDASGKQISLKPVMAEGDWMTSEYVPFNMQFTFPQTDATSGVLIFHKDNAQGGVEKDDAIRIPVKFNQQMRSVQVYLYNKSSDLSESGVPHCDESNIVAVPRDIPITKTPLQDTLSILFAGSVRPEEKSKGYESLFPLTGLGVKTLTLTQLGELLLTLNDPYNKTIGGSCRIRLLKWQLEKTMKQFDGVKTVITKPDSLFQP